MSANPSVLVVDLPHDTTADSPAVKAGLAAADKVAASVPGCATCRTPAPATVPWSALAEPRPW